jgi:hypothetical protein
MRVVVEGSYRGAMAEKVRIDPDVLLLGRREFAAWFDDWIVDPRTIHDDDAAVIEQRLVQGVGLRLQTLNRDLALVALLVSLSAVTFAVSDALRDLALSIALGAVAMAGAAFAVVLVIVRQRQLGRMTRRVREVERLRLILAREPSPPLPWWRRVFG